MKTSVEEIKANLNFRDIFAEYFPQQYRKNGNSHCPFHDDHKPSFQVNNDYGVCHAGCTPASNSKRWDIIDLHERRFNVNRAAAIRNLAKRANVVAESQTNRTTRQLVKVYDYRDDQGRVAYSKLRYEPKSFSWHRPDPQNSNKYIAGIAALKRYLYNLPAILSSLPETPVVFAEGEKDADALSALGFVSTTVGSSQGWAKLVGEHEVHKPLTGRTVWIIPDKDVPSRKFGIQVSASLQSVCREVKLFELPGDGIKDAHDFISHHGKESRRLIEELAAKAPVIVTDISVSPAVNSTIRQNQLSRFQKLDLCFAKTGWSLFFDQLGECWAEVEIQDHRENVRVPGGRITNLLRGRYKSDYGEGIGRELVDQVIGARIGELENNPITRKVANRATWDESKSKIYVDSGTTDWSVIEITADNWKIVQPKQSLFQRRHSYRPYDCLPDASRNGWDDLFKILRVDNQDYRDLIKIWLAVALIPDIPRPGLILTGSSGVGKSFASKRLKHIIDPSRTLSSDVKKDVDDLKLKLFRHFVPNFDNCNQLDIEQSDTFCQSTTGISYEKRKIYTIDETVSWIIKRTWIMTAVNVPGTMSDFLSRAFLVELSSIPNSERRDEVELLREFDMIRPGIQAFIFDCISAGLKNLKNVRTSDFHRLADAHRFSLAMSGALGLTHERIDTLWNQNRDNQAQETFDGDIVAQRLESFLQNSTPDGQWEGTAGELYETLGNYCSSADKYWTKDWPKSISHLGRRLNYLAETLKTRGIFITERAGRVKSINYKPYDAGIHDRPTLLSTEQKHERLKSLGCEQCNSFNPQSGTCGSFKPAISLDSPSIVCPRQLSAMTPVDSDCYKNSDSFLGQVM